MYNISIASDHAGFLLKKSIISYLASKEYTIKDLGTFSDSESVDYPDYASILCESILENEGSLGILICATGIGMSISANRFSGIRAALCTSPSMAELARQHNDANILVLGSKISSIDESLLMAQKFLDSKFEGGRHIKRISKIS